MRPVVKRVLYVEPSEDVCSMMLSLLRSRGFRPDSASTISEALEKASETGFDLYIVDDFYSDGTNRELIGRLRALTPTVPVLVFSTQDFVDSRRAALAAGAADYFIQPGDISYLLRAVERLCGGAPAASA